MRVKSSTEQDWAKKKTRSKWVMRKHTVTAHFHTCRPVVNCINKSASLIMLFKLSHRPTSAVHARVVHPHNEVFLFHKICPPIIEVKLLSPVMIGWSSNDDNKSYYYYQRRSVQCSTTTTTNVFIYEDRISEKQGVFEWHPYINSLTFFDLNSQTAAEFLCFKYFQPAYNNLLPPSISFQEGTMQC